MVKKIIMVPVVIMMLAGLLSAAQFVDNFSSYGDTGYKYTGESIGPWTVTGGSAMMVRELRHIQR